MDDGLLWELMTFHNAPVAHCRAKVVHDRTRMIARQAARFERENSRRSAR